MFCSYFLLSLSDHRQNKHNVIFKGCSKGQRLVATSGALPGSRYFISETSHILARDWFGVVAYIVPHGTHHGFQRILYITRLTMGLYAYCTSPHSPWAFKHILHHQTHHGLVHILHLSRLTMGLYIHPRIVHLLIVPHQTHHGFVNVSYLTIPCVCRRIVPH